MVNIMCGAAIIAHSLFTASMAAPRAYFYGRMMRFLLRYQQ
jgi:hypothetical protein